MFFVQFLLIDIRHDIVSNFGKVTFCWLALFLNFFNKSLKKSYVKPFRDHPLSMYAKFSKELTFWKN